MSLDAGALGALTEVVQKRRIDALSLEMVESLPVEAFEVLAIISNRALEHQVVGDRRRQALMLREKVLEQVTKALDQFRTVQNSFRRSASLSDEYDEIDWVEDEIGADNDQLWSTLQRVCERGARSYFPEIETSKIAPDSSSPPSAHTAIEVSPTSQSEKHVGAHRPAKLGPLFREALADIYGKTMVKGSKPMPEIKAKLRAWLDARGMNEVKIDARTVARALDWGKK